METRTREAMLEAVWRNTTRDYRALIGGRRCVLARRPGGTMLVPVECLTGEEIERRLPLAWRECRGC